MLDLTRASNPHDATIAALSRAVDGRSAQGLIDLLAPDIIVRSPITQMIRFEGIEQARDLFHRVFAIISDTKMYEVVGGGEATQVIFWKGRVGGTYLEEANLIRMNAAGQITEMTVFMRALPGLLDLAARIAPSLASRHGRIRALFIRVQLVILSTVFRMAEPMVIRLTKAGVPVPQGYSSQDPPSERPIV